MNFNVYNFMFQIMIMCNDYWAMRFQKRKKEKKRKESKKENWNNPYLNSVRKIYKET